MRDIKFRGKANIDVDTSGESVEKGDWVYGHYAFYQGNHVIVARLVGECGGMGDGLVTCIIWVDPETVGQYTGLKDKNGKEIYEGDITSTAKFSEMRDRGKKYRFISGKWNAHIVFEDAAFRLKTPDGEIGISPINDKSKADCYKYEVIGNIYENPDMLK